jgi:hypothetical protein
MEVTPLPWWEAVLFLIAVALAVWGFISLARFDTRLVTRRTNRSAEDLYSSHANLSRKQRRYAREHADDGHGTGDV